MHGIFPVITPIAASLTETTVLEIQSIKEAINKVNQQLIELSAVVPSKAEYSKFNETRTRPEDIDLSVTKSKTFELNFSSSEILSRLPHFSRNKCVVYSLLILTV